MGREITHDVISELQDIGAKSGLDLCGENGEFHTMVRALGDFCATRESTIFSMPYVLHCKKTAIVYSCSLCLLLIPEKGRHLGLAHKNWLS